MRPRDFQRKKVYVSEKVLTPVSRKFKTVKEMQDYIDSCILHPDLKDLDLVIEVRDGRGRRSACWKGLGAKGKGIISMPVFCRNDAVLLHELAHCVNGIDKETCDYSVHGKEFCAVFLKLVQLFMGELDYNTLVNSFKEHGVLFSI
jgi:putative metallohydrolase (TIGR04338 family)